MLEKLLSNPAFIGAIGVVIGSGISLFGTVLSQIILSRKEQKQWENKQLAEKSAWARDEQKKEKEYLREIYQNCLRTLSVFIALEDQKEDSKEKQKLELIGEVHTWISILLLRHSDSKLNSALNAFTSVPDEYEANILRNEVIRLSNKEEGFFINELTDNSSKEEINNDPDLRTVQITIDDNFRKQQLINGVEIQQKFEFKFKLSKMSNSQRGILAEIYFQSNKTIPNKFSLYLPVYNKAYKQITLNDKHWNAKLNPLTTSLEEIISQWENDYDNNYKEATLNLESQ